MLRFFTGLDAFADRTQATALFTVGSTNDVWVFLSTSLGRNGKGCWRFGSSIAGANAKFSLPSGPHTSNIVLGVAYNHYTSAVGYASIIFQLQNSGGSAILTLMVNTSGYLVLKRGGTGGTVLATGTTFVASGSWFFIELKTDIHASTGSFEVRINGSSEISDSGVNTEGASGGATQCQLQGNTNGGTNLYCLYDDLYFADGAAGVVTDFIGDCQATCVVPNADTAQKDFSRSAGGDNYALVDEVLPNGDTDYVFSTTSGHKDRYTVAASGLTGVQVLGVNVVAVAKEPTAGGTQIKGVIKSGTTESSGAAMSIDTTYKGYNTLFEKNPDTASQWLVSELDSAEIGHELV